MKASLVKTISSETPLKESRYSETENCDKTEISMIPVHLKDTLNYLHKMGKSVTGIGLHRSKRLNRIGISKITLECHMSFLYAAFVERV